MKKKYMVVYLLLSLVFSISGTSLLAEGAGNTANVKKYDVVFKAEGGVFDQKAGTKELAKQVEEKKAVAQPSTPTKEGYQFVGWYTDQKLTKAWDFKSTITSNTTLFAKWDVAVKNYQVSFNTSEGSVIAPQTVKEKQAVVQPKAPTKAGFTFAGWFSDQQLTQAWNFATPITANTTLFTKWDAVVNEYVVTFSINGGSAVASQSVREGQPIAQPQAPIREGFTFGGWFSDQQLTQAWDFASPVTGALTLYASWNPIVNKYNVTFNTNGGTVIPVQQVTENHFAVEPQAPTKQGVTFGGWYSDEQLTKKWDFKTVITGNLTLFAKWDVPVVVKEYQVTFNSNGGTAITSQQVKENQFVIQPAAPTKKGFTFGGWYSDAQLTNTWDFTTAIKANTTLYAKWLPVVVKEYQVTFNTNGGTLISAQQVKENQPVSQPVAPTKKDFTFGGWYSDEKLTKAWDFKTTIIGNTILYAKWNKADVKPPVTKTYQIDFNTNGGSAILSQTVKEGQAVAQPKNPTRTGFTFAGWFTDQALTKAWDFKTTVTGNATLYAKWVAVPTKKQPVTPVKKKKIPVTNKKVLTKKNQLPQTGDTQGSTLSLVIGTLLLLTTFVVVIKKSKLNANKQ